MQTFENLENGILESLEKASTASTNQLNRLTFHRAYEDYIFIIPKM
jgi:hypothetical protein